MDGQKGKDKTTDKKPPPKMQQRAPGRDDPETSEFSHLEETDGEGSRSPPVYVASAREGETSKSPERARGGKGLDPAGAGSKPAKPPRAPVEQVKTEKPERLGGGNNKMYPDLSGAATGGEGKAYVPPGGASTVDIKAVKEEPSVNKEEETWVEVMVEGKRTMVPKSVFVQSQPPMQPFAERRVMAETPVYKPGSVYSMELMDSQRQYRYEKDLREFRRIHPDGASTPTWREYMAQRYPHEQYYLRNLANFGDDRRLISDLQAHPGNRSYTQRDDSLGRRPFTTSVGPSNQLENAEMYHSVMGDSLHTIVDPSSTRRIYDQVSREERDRTPVSDFPLYQSRQAVEQWVPNKLVPLSDDRDLMSQDLDYNDRRVNPHASLEQKSEVNHLHYVNQPSRKLLPWRYPLPVDNRPRSVMDTKRSRRETPKPLLGRQGDQVKDFNVSSSKAAMNVDRGRGEVNELPLAAQRNLNAQDIDIMEKLVDRLHFLEQERYWKMMAERRPSSNPEYENQESKAEGESDHYWNTMPGRGRTSHREHNYQRKRSGEKSKTRSNRDMDQTSEHSYRSQMSRRSSSRSQHRRRRRDEEDKRPTIFADPGTSSSEDEDTPLPRDTAKEVKYPKFQGGEDKFNRYRLVFEYIARQKKLPHRHWANTLRLHLEGQALVQVVIRDPGSVWGYRKLCKYLTEAYDTISPAIAMNNFRCIAQYESENVTSFGNRLIEGLHWAMPQLTGNYAQLRESQMGQMYLCSQFLYGVRPELYEKVPKAIKIEDFDKLLEEFVTVEKHDRTMKGRPNRRAAGSAPGEVRSAMRTSQPLGRTLPRGMVRFNTPSSASSITGNVRNITHDFENQEVNLMEAAEGVPLTRKELDEVLRGFNADLMNAVDMKNKDTEDKLEKLQAQTAVPRSRPGSPGPLICYHCEKPGHMARDCPQKMGRDNTRRPMGEGPRTSEGPRRGNPRRDSPGRQAGYAVSANLPPYANLTKQHYAVGTSHPLWYTDVIHTEQDVLPESDGEVELEHYNYCNMITVSPPPVIESRASTQASTVALDTVSTTLDTSEADESVAIHSPVDRMRELQQAAKQNYEDAQRTQLLPGTPANTQDGENPAQPARRNPWSILTPPTLPWSQGRRYDLTPMEEFMFDQELMTEESKDTRTGRCFGVTRSVICVMLSFLIMCFIALVLVVGIRIVIPHVQSLNKETNNTLPIMDSSESTDGGREIYYQKVLTIPITPNPHNIPGMTRGMTMSPEDLLIVKTENIEHAFYPAENRRASWKGAWFSGGSPTGNNQRRMRTLSENGKSVARVSLLQKTAKGWINPVMIISILQKRADWGQKQRMFQHASQEDMMGQDREFVTKLLDRIRRDYRYLNESQIPRIYNEQRMANTSLIWGMDELIKTRLPNGTQHNVVDKEVINAMMSYCSVVRQFGTGNAVTHLVSTELILLWSNYFLTGATEWTPNRVIYPVEVVGLWRMKDPRLQQILQQIPREDLMHLPVTLREPLLRQWGHKEDYRQDTSEELQVLPWVYVLNITQSISEAAAQQCSQEDLHVLEWGVCISRAKQVMVNDLVILVKHQYLNGFEVESAPGWIRRIQNPTYDTTLVKSSLIQDILTVEHFNKNYHSMTIADHQFGPDEEFDPTTSPPRGGEVRILLLLG